jgi:hypothetical protein
MMGVNVETGWKRVEGRAKNKGGSPLSGAGPDAARLTRRAWILVLGWRGKAIAKGGTTNELS